MSEDDKIFAEEMMADRSEEIKDVIAKGKKLEALAANCNYRDCGCGDFKLSPIPFICDTCGHHFHYHI